jgi:RimJ/RimL family protein N-acetyltransferase
VNTGTSYEIQVAGHLDEHWADRLGGLRIAHLHGGTTLLTGTVQDQAQLHGILTGIRDLGADLLAVHSQTPQPDRTPPTVRTARLTLRPATPHDADATWTYRRLPEVGEWLTQLPADLDTHRERFARPDRLAATVVVERDGHLVGDLMLRVRDAWAQVEVADRAHRAEAELGWVLDPAHHGHGYATEAVHALIRTAFHDIGLRRVTATCFGDNHASRRLMERAGMHREAHHVRDALHRSGRWLDTLDYAALADTWSP